MDVTVKEGVTTVTLTFRPEEVVTMKETAAYYNNSCCSVTDCVISSSDFEVIIETLIEEFEE
jgi:hypothetical protein